MTGSRRPSVLFVCVKNGGKSQMAAGLMRKIADGLVDVHSAGKRPGHEINGLAAESLAEIGIDISGEIPKAVDGRLLQSADVVVTLGREAHVEPVDGPRFEVWDTDEPSERGIDGIERMHLIRDDIEVRILVCSTGWPTVVRDPRRRVMSERRCDPQQHVANMTLRI